MVHPSSNIYMWKPFTMTILYYVLLVLIKMIWSLHHFSTPANQFIPVTVRLDDSSSYESLQPHISLYRNKLINVRKKKGPNVKRFHICSSVLFKNLGCLTIFNRKSTLVQTKGTNYGTLQKKNFNAILNLVLEFLAFTSKNY